MVREGIRRCLDTLLLKVLIRVRSPTIIVFLRSDSLCNLLELLELLELLLLYLETFNMIGILGTENCCHGNFIL